MACYKILLVDDEEEVRQAIANKLDWESLGFQVVGEAGNGEEALELSEQLQPDVIMTDIKMPFMDGLTFCRRVKGLLPDVKVAIFSGFDEFEYAKEAIRLEVEEYILKPINADELADVFRRLRSVLDTEIAERQDVQRLRRFYEESMPLMRQQLLTGLLEGNLEADFLHRKMQEYGLDLSADQYCVAVVRHEDPEAAKEIPRSGSGLVSLSLQQIITEKLNSSLPCRIIPVLDHIVLLFMLAPDRGPQDITALLNQLFLPARRFLGISLSIGVGNAYPRLENIAQSYEDARDALEYQMLVGSEQCVFIGDIEPGTGSLEPGDMLFAEEIVRQIKIGQRADLEAAIQKLVQHFKSHPISPQQYQIFLLEISAELLKLIKAYKLDMDEPVLSSALLEKSALHFSNLDEMGRWLLEYCDNLRFLVRRERKDSTKTMIERAKAHLATHYNDWGLSVEALSRVLNVSPAYFSTIFKKETGHNFVSYLTQLRLEKALEYLNTTDEKTYVIAEKVGYSDPNYFSYVFKKQYGVSPSKYRTDRMNRHDTDQKSG